MNDAADGSVIKFGVTGIVDGPKNAMMATEKCQVTNFIITIRDFVRKLAMVRILK